MKVLKASLVALGSLTFLGNVVAQTTSAPQAKAESAAATGKAGFRVTVGQGYSVCEAYVRNLKALASKGQSPAICEIQIHPEFTAFKKPDWEELGIKSNLRLIHAAELLLKDWLVPRHHPSPVFDDWVSKYQQQVDSGEFQPQLRRTRLALNERGVETLIWYRRDTRECERSNGMRGFGPGGHILLLRDDAEHPLEIIEAFGSHAERDLISYRGKPFLFVSGWELPDRWSLGVDTVFPRTKLTVGPHVERYVLKPRCEIEFHK